MSFVKLALSSSLQTLPDDIKDFIDGIHHHFVSPQRKARLARIQANLGENKLLPKNYIKTRWLSLGESLSRLLKIWGSLIIYMETGKNEEGLKKFDFKYYLDLLQDQLFFLKIVFLTNIINRINETNIKLQSQSVEIQHLKSELLQLFQWMTKLIVMPEKIPQDALEIMNIDWKDETNIGDLLLNNDNFISYISEMIDVRLQKLQEKSIKKKQQKEFITLFQSLIKEILFQLSYYLPLKDQVIQISDFVTLRGSNHQIEQKILNFNDTFNVFPKEQKPELIKEIMSLVNLDITKELDTAKLSSLYLWDLIERRSDFSYLPQIFRIAHSLPISSATVEQTFSVMKLMKTAIRNRLQESTLQSLLMIHQEFKDCSKDSRISVSDEVIRLFSNAKDDLNSRKSYLSNFSLFSLIYLIGRS